MRLVAKQQTAPCPPSDTMSVMASRDGPHDVGGKVVLLRPGQVAVAPVQLPPDLPGVVVEGEDGAKGPLLLRAERGAEQEGLKLLGGQSLDQAADAGGACVATAASSWSWGLLRVLKDECSSIGVCAGSLCDWGAHGSFVLLLVEQVAREAMSSEDRFPAL